MITINANRAATARTRRRRDGRPRSPAGGGARHNHPRQRQQHPAGEVGERETGISQSQFARRRRRNDGRGGGRGGGLMRALPFLGGVIMIGSMTRGTEAQFVDGGAVAMSCDECACEGSSDDGTIAVLDNPSSGARVREIVCFVDGRIEIISAVQMTPQLRKSEQCYCSLGGRYASSWMGCSWLQIGIRSVSPALVRLLYTREPAKGSGRQKAVVFCELR